MDDAARAEGETLTNYDRDFAAWAFDQAERLRATADRGANGLNLDWRNLAEEIEGAARRDRREVASHIRTVVQHLMKLEALPTTGPRADWEQGIHNARREIELIIDDSPSLRASVAEIVKGAVEQARQATTRALAKHGETPNPPIESLNYTPDQITGDWWPDEQRALSSGG